MYAGKRGLVGRGTKNSGAQGAYVNDEKQQQNNFDPLPSKSSLVADKLVDVSCCCCCCVGASAIATFVR